MFGWLPIIGPIIDGIVSIFVKSKDVEVEKYKTDADVRKTEVRASVDTLSTFRDDIGVRLARDIILFPVAVFTALTIWDYTVVTNHPDWVWGTVAIPEKSGLGYLPYAVMVFLFGNLWLNKRR